MFRQNQVSTLKTFIQLIWDTDFNNISNILVDESWKIWKVDSSRAFRIDAGLRREDSLTRFSRTLLSSLEDLDHSEFEKVLSPWLNARQVKTLWQRRTRILELAPEDRLMVVEPGVTNQAIQEAAAEHGFQCNERPEASLSRDRCRLLPGHKLWLRF